MLRNIIHHVASKYKLVIKQESTLEEMHFIGLVGREVQFRSIWDSGLGKEGEGFTTSGIFLMLIEGE